MKLLVAVSRVPYSASSLDRIAKLAGPDPVFIVHIAQRGWTDGGTMLAETQRELAARGATVDSLLEHGDDAADIILRTAKTRACDIIIMRAADRSPGILTRVFGDTVSRVVERADRAVLALRSGEAAQGDGILLGSGRPGPELLDATAALALATASPVTVLHVEPSTTNEDLFHDIFQLPDPSAHKTAPRTVASLERAVGALRARGVETHARIREGIVEEQLAREANDGDHWLLVVRGRSTGRWKRVFLGHNFTEDIVRHVRSSILVTK